MTRLLTAITVALAIACGMAGGAASQAPSPDASRAPQPAAPSSPPGFPERRGGALPGIVVTDDMLASGRRLYESNCAMCHGQQGRGDGGAAAHLSSKPADQTDRRVMEILTDLEIARRVQYGGFQMPSFTAIRGDDLVALVAYVRSLSQRRVRAVELQSLAQGEVKDFVPVTDEFLRRPAAEDWPMFRRTYDGWGYSPLDQIRRDNVAELQLAWSRAMEPGGQYSTPLVYRGVMYLGNPGDVIQALDASNGDLIWQFQWDGPPTSTAAPPRAARRPDRSRDEPGSAADITERRPARRGRSMRNLAIYQDKIFHLTRDLHIVAIEARTGALAWYTAENARGAGHMAGPMVADGKVITGRSCAAAGGPEICYIAAHDAATGREVWRVHTIPRPGEPGDETWGGLPYEQRRHVGAWGSGSYDPDLNLIYWGTSVPTPSLEVLRGTAGKDVLYSNSTLAIDAATGKVTWYFQHLPRDNWDFDHVFERILVDVPVAPDAAEVAWINPALEPGAARKVVTGIPGKTGIVYTLDRTTGEFLWARETIHQNVVTGLDPRTGRASINEELIVRPFVETLVCPSLGGGKDWPAGAYSPRTRLMYEPQQNMCMQMMGNTGKPTPADGYATSWVIIPDPAVVAQPYPVGRIDAVSAETGRRAWLHQQRAGMIGTLLATGGGLVFGGDVNRRFMAFDESSGEVLWETAVSGPVSGSAVGYAVRGEEYIAVTVGGDTASPEERVLGLHPEIKPPQGSNAVFVFKAGRRRSETLSSTLPTVVPIVVGLAGGLMLIAAGRRARRAGAGTAGRPLGS
jgi:alcohol dehydrogenase (cytochrome c)